MVCLLHSVLSSSHASQKSMFSSLYSVRKNSRKTLRPAGLFISLSKDCAQPCTSSGVGLALTGPWGGKGKVLQPARDPTVSLLLIPGPTPEELCPIASPVPTKRCSCSGSGAVELSEVTSGVCPHSAQPGWSVALLWDGFPILGCVLVLALHKSQQEEKPFGGEAALSQETDMGPSLLSAGEGGRLFPSKCSAPAQAGQVHSLSMAN